MFKIGIDYEVIVLEADEKGIYGTGSIVKTVSEIDGNLVKFADGEIINTTSPLFHSASDIEARKKFYSEHEPSMVKVVDEFPE